MKMKFIDPDQIFGTVLALIILAVGVFASFTVFANIPATVPAGTANRAGTGTITNAVHIDFNGTLRWIPTPSFINNTAVCYLEGQTAGDTPHWMVLQAAGACNGTFMSNSTYRVSQPGTHLSNRSVRLTYSTTTGVTNALSNSTYTAILNVSATSTSVFNIIGVVLIIAAIMAIVGLVYSFIKPRM